MLILANSYKLSLKLIFNFIFYFYYAYSSGKIKGDSKQTCWSISRIFYQGIWTKLAGGWPPCFFHYFITSHLTFDWVKIDGSI